MSRQKRLKFFKTASSKLERLISELDSENDLEKVIFLSFLIQNFLSFSSGKCIFMYGSGVDV